MHRWRWRWLVLRADAARRPQVGDHGLGHFERGEVTAGGVFGPVIDVRVVAFGQRADGLEVVLEQRDPDPGPVNTDSNVEDPSVDAAVLTALAAAIRDHQGLRCIYRDDRLELEPYRMIAWQRRWYLVGRDRSTGDWSPYRVDWLTLRTPGGRQFEPQPFPGDMTEFVVREVARTGRAVHARIVIDAPAEEVIARINPAVGTVEPLPDGRSVLVTGGDSLEVVAAWIGMLGLDFTVQEPPELIGHLRLLSERYARATAVPPSPTG